MTTSQIPAVERTLTDCKGVDHLYEITPLAYDASFNLGLELADLIGGPIGEALKAMMVGGDVDLDSIDDASIGQALAELTALPRRILAAGGATLVARMFVGTMRVTSPDANGERAKGHLDQADARTVAFAGGNQAESVMALKAVIKVNYGPFLAGLSEIVSPYLGGFASSLASFGQKSPEKMTPKTQTPGASAPSGQNTSGPTKPVEPQ